MARAADHPARILRYPARAGRSPSVAALAMVLRALRGAVYAARRTEDPGAAPRAAVALARRFAAVLAGLERLPFDDARRRPAFVSFRLVALAAAEAIEDRADGHARAWVALAHLVAWVEADTARDEPPTRLPPRRRPRGPGRSPRVAAE